jgi:hypothetical protein
MNVDMDMTVDMDMEVDRGGVHTRGDTLLQLASPVTCDLATCELGRPWAAASAHQAWPCKERLREYIIVASY